jgi:Tol biopolymer transport system component
MEKAGRFRKIAAEPVQLTTGPLSFRNPLVSKDGKKLFVIGQQKRGELVRYDARSRQFVPFLGGIAASFVDFSRDGQWVAYVTYPEFSLWRSRVDGSDRLQLTSFLGVGSPHWSPDGTRIAFLGCAGGKPLKIFLISAEGGNPQQVLPGERSEGSATWSPDGSSLSFGRTPDLELRAFGSAPVQILNLKSGQVSAVPDSDGFYGVSWSPDGRYLSAMTSDSSKLMLFDFTSKKWLELAKGSFAFPGWSHDGRYIYFEDFGKGEIRRVEVSSQKFEGVVGITELRRPGDYAGIWSAPAYDGSPMVMRDIGIEEVYALDLKLP